MEPDAPRNDLETHLSRFGEVDEVFKLCLHDSLVPHDPTNHVLVQYY